MKAGDIHVDGRWAFVIALMGLIFLTIWFGMLRSCEMHSDDVLRDIRIEEAKQKGAQK